MPTFESFTISGTELNDGVSFDMESFDAPPPAKRPTWITGADSDGAALVDDPKASNREITLRLRVVQQASMDLALAKLGTIIDLLEESEKQPDGLACVWTPANSTKSITFDCLSGEVVGVPVTTQGDDAG